jgi:hypothetical protein
MPPKPKTNSDKLTEKARKLHEQQHQNTIDMIARFRPFVLSDWKAAGETMIVFDTGHDDEHGAEGIVVITGESTARLISYVWDAVVCVKRWVSVRAMDIATEVDEP